jgi:Uma2 family endonuclease
MSAGTLQATASTPQLHLVPTLPVWRLSVAQYHQMIQTGILTEDDPVELLEGWLIPKMPKNPPHRVCTALVHKALMRLLPADFYVDVQEPLTTADSEPEPDVMVVRGTPRDYVNRHPQGQEAALVVEVADGSLPRDRAQKKRIYARAGVPVYWIINLNENQLEVYTEPAGAAEQADYQTRQDYQPTDEVPLVLDGTEIGRSLVSELLP